MGPEVELREVVVAGPQGSRKVDVRRLLLFGRFSLVTRKSKRKLLATVGKSVARVSDSIAEGLRKIVLSRGGQNEDGR